MSFISHIHIAYGSESGNAANLANQLAQQPCLAAFSPACSSLNQLDLDSLDENSLLLIVTSSFGDGDAVAFAGGAGLDGV